MIVARFFWLLLALAAGPGEAVAHATLLSSVPADAALLSQAPAEVVLRFDEPVAPISLRLIDNAGAALPLEGQARTQGENVHVPLPATLKQGTYLLSYRVVSADSHPVVGSLAFSVGLAQQQARPVAVAEESASPLGPGGIWVRGLRDIFLLVAMGAALFSVWVGGFPGQRAALTIAALAAALLSGLGAMAQAAALMGQPIALSTTLITMGLKTSSGSSALLTIAATALIAAGAGFSSQRVRATLLTAGALLVPVSLVLTGHAASAQPAWLASTAVAAHILVAGFWAGSLVALFLLLQQRDPRSGAGLRRFSAIAMPAVGLLIVAGAGFAALQLGSLQALVEGRYGQLVLLKSALLLILLALAGGNRFILMPRLQRAVPTAETALRRAIVAEMVLVALVVSATAVLSQTPPHEAWVRVELSGASSHSGTLTVEPGVAGHNVFVVDLRDAQNRPIDPEETSLVFSNPAAGMEAMERSLTRTGPGTFRFEGHEIAFSGPWQVEVRARLGDFDRVELRATLRMR